MSKHRRQLTPLHWKGVPRVLCPGREPRGRQEGSGQWPRGPQPLPTRLQGPAAWLEEPGEVGAG